MFYMPHVKFIVKQAYFINFIPKWDLPSSPAGLENSSTVSFMKGGKISELLKNFDPSSVNVYFGGSCSTSLNCW